MCGHLEACSFSEFWVSIDTSFHYLFLSICGHSSFSVTMVTASSGAVVVRANFWLSKGFDKYNTRISIQ